LQFLHNNKKLNETSWRSYLWSITKRKNCSNRYWGKSYETLFSFRIDSDTNLSENDIFSQLKNWFSSNNIFKNNISKIAIVSVVKELTYKFSNVSRLLFGLESIIVSQKDFQLHLKNEYYNINELGLDRLCNAYAAKHKFNNSSIVIDFGSAITLEIIDKRGIFVGGMILPGIKLSSEVLNSKTSLLPKINLTTFPNKVIGKSTEECISSGIMFGTQELCRGLITEIEKELGEEKMTVIITGGYSHLFKYKLGREVILEKDLVSLGVLFLILNNNGK